MGSRASDIRIVERRFGPAYHWYHIVIPDAVIVMTPVSPGSGGGMVPFLMRVSPSH